MKSITPPSLKRAFRLLFNWMLPDCSQEARKVECNAKCNTEQMETSEYGHVPVFGDSFEKTVTPICNGIFGQ